LYVIKEPNDTFVDFNALTGIIKFKIPIKIRKIRHNVINITLDKHDTLDSHKLIEEYSNIRDELSLDVKPVTFDDSLYPRLASSRVLMCDFKVKDCLRLETLEEGNIYNISVLSSKSFRGKKIYLILLARPESLGITDEKYVSNSSFEVHDRQ